MTVFYGILQKTGNPVTNLFGKYRLFKIASLNNIYRVCLHSINAVLYLNLAVVWLPNVQTTFEKMEEEINIIDLFEGMFNSNAFDKRHLC